MVFGLRNSVAAASRVVFPPASRTAICSSCGVSSSIVLGSREQRLAARGQLGARARPTAGRRDARTPRPRHAAARAPGPGPAHAAGAAVREPRPRGLEPVQRVGVEAERPLELLRVVAVAGHQPAAAQCARHRPRLPLGLRRVHELAATTSASPSGRAARRRRRARRRREVDVGDPELGAATAADPRSAWQPARRCRDRARARRARRPPTPRTTAFRFRRTAGSPRAASARVSCSRPRRACSHARPARPKSARCVARSPGPYRSLPGRWPRRSPSDRTWPGRGRAD